MGALVTLNPNPQIAAPAMVKVIRSLNGITPDVTIEEQHQDLLQITDHPVEQGAMISDHAVKLPAEVVVTYGWADSSSQNTAAAASFLNDLYEKILQVQSSVSLFMVYTSRRIYKNMLLASVTMTTDKETDRAMVVRLLCREVNIVRTTTITVSLDQTTQALPPKTLPVAGRGTQSLQKAPTFSYPNWNLHLAPFIR
jgi:hypothetical protein